MASAENPNPQSPDDRSNRTSSEHDTSAEIGNSSDTNSKTSVSQSDQKTMTQLHHPSDEALRTTIDDSHSPNVYLKLREVNRCVLEKQIGSGGMGVVFKARHQDLDIDVAVKFLHPQLITNPGASARFLREARLAARLQSPGFVRVFACGETEGHFYIVMEFVDGQTLADHLDERGTIPIARALQITELIATALKESLQQIGMIHRDIKPSNILLTSNGQVKLADLGLAKMNLSSANPTAFETAAGVILGTPSYMSPEQCTDAGSVDHRADIYSLGATLFQMLIGRAPFQGDHYLKIIKQILDSEPVHIPDEIPETVRALVHQMMNKNPEERFATYDELITAIRNAQQSLGKTSEQVKIDISKAIREKTISELVLPVNNVPRASPTENRVLLVVDVQNDFCSNGPLAVPGSEEVIPVINRLSRRFSHVILTQDWHREDHFSFASSHPGKKPHDRIRLNYGEQILWPDHCVQGTNGAEFHPELEVDNCELIIRKGYHREIDSYSAFFENDRRTPTGLTGYLRERGMTRLYIVGLATDFCVAYSALDARKLGFEVTIIEAACRGIDINGSLSAAWDEMLEAGVIRS